MYATLACGSTLTGQFDSTGTVRMIHGLVMRTWCLTTVSGMCKTTDGVFSVARMIIVQH